VGLPIRHPTSHTGRSSPGHTAYGTPLAKLASLAQTASAAARFASPPTTPEWGARWRSHSKGLNGGGQRLPQSVRVRGRQRGVASTKPARSSLGGLFPSAGTDRTDRTRRFRKPDWRSRRRRNLWGVSHPSRCPIVPVHTSAPVGREADVRREGCRPGPVVWLSSTIALSDTREKCPFGRPYPTDVGSCSLSGKGGIHSAWFPSSGDRRNRCCAVLCSPCWSG
jgi:hypothetical protein